jgi:hypothetical protein
MRLELVGLIIAALGGLVAFVLSYSEEKKSWRRRLRLLGLVLGTLGGLCGFELVTRSRELGAAHAGLDRRWILLQNAPIDAVEIEFLLPDGTARLEDVSNELRRLRVSVPGVRLFSPTPSGAVSTIDLASNLSFDALRRQGRLGIANARVSTTEDGGKDIEAVTCIASAYTTSEVLSRPAENQASALVCSVAIRMPVIQPGPKIGALKSDKTRVAVTLVDATDRAAPLRCVGPCRDPMLSVRLVTREDGQLLPTLIEVSPLLYNVRPSTSTARRALTAAELPGPDALGLAESRFKQSFGFRDAEYFAFTKGAFNAAYQYFTSREDTMEFVDVVWVTDASPPQKLLLDAVPPNTRPAAQPFRVDEWCGFGEREHCWNRFAVFTSVPR